MPVYTPNFPGFIPSSEDVPLAVEGRTLFAGVWNARPVLQDDLGSIAGFINADELEKVRDAYWAAMDGRGVPTGQGLGSRPRWWQRRRIRRFQSGELERWSHLSGRAFTDDLVPAPPEEAQAVVQNNPGQLITVREIVAWVDGIRGEWVGGALEQVLRATSLTIHDQDLPRQRAEIDPTAHVARIVVDFGGDAVPEQAGGTDSENQYEIFGRPDWPSQRFDGWSGPAQVTR
ncbi:MAG: hypothetical protein WD737_14170 [Gemmatimonadota bacterium]